MAIEFDIDEFEDGRVSVQSIAVDGETIDGTGEESIAAPKGLIAKVALKDIDARVWLEPADSVFDDLVTLSTVPYRLRVIDSKSAEVVFDETGKF